LLNDNGHVLIGDFGLGRDEYVDVTPICGGTVGYAAPEMFEERSNLTQRVDVYSFGLILYEILEGSPVFGEADTPFDIIRKKRAGEFPLIGSRVFPSMSDLIQGSWQTTSDNRPSFADILSILESNDFKIVRDADYQTVGEYVKGISDWELGHPCGPSLETVFPSSPGQILSKRKWETLI
jgi:serine/threonine protein kinase